MADLFDISTRIIDSGQVDTPVNRITNELSELDDGLAIVESFSHCVALRTAEGVVCFDSSGVITGEAVVNALRGWTDDPISHLVYTHGHADHVGGSRFFAAAAERDGRQRPRVIGHDNVAARLDRYRYTSDWNVQINRRQFGGVGGTIAVGIGAGSNEGGGALPPFLPDDTLRPDETFTDVHSMYVGGEHIELHHARGETDDHLWAWLPDRRCIMSGDFVIWNFPNAGNPQKVQRYPSEWAAALRAMIAQQPEMLLPAHGLVISGRERIATVLDDIATALENLVSDVVAMMNGGATLDTIVHTVKVPQETLAKPYLRPLYDEPEFVVHNIWRLYGGWWDGVASHLKPAPDATVAVALAELAGGAEVLMRRAHQAAAAGDLRLACHLADFAGSAAPADPAIHAARAEIYQARRKAEPSLMSKGIYQAASRESERIANPPA
ncbi:MAG: alkyl sulfatase dimerization domain-containing protein [Ilumatobacteraceae bacterium]